MKQETDFAFCYLSEILGRKVSDRAGEMVGKIRDLVATSEGTYPIIRAVVVRLKSGRRALGRYR